MKGVAFRLSMGTMSSSYGESKVALRHRRRDAEARDICIVSQHPHDEVLPATGAWNPLEERPFRGPR